MGLTSRCLLYFFRERFVVKFGDIKEELSTALPNETLFGAMINSNNSHCHSLGSDLARKMALVS